MPLQFGVDLRNARLDAIVAAVGGSPILQLWSGAAPDNCGAADSGTLLAQFSLPSTWMNAASGGTATKAGTWQGTAHANANGGTVVGHFRIRNAAGTVVHLQGTVTATGGGGDMTLDNVSIASGQTITVTTFTITSGNA